MKEEHREEIEKRKKTIRKKDMVIPGDDDKMAQLSRTLTSPGPPNRIHNGEGRQLFVENLPPGSSETEITVTSVTYIELCSNIL